ncbi:MAG: phospho-N-acetylmuramoyl-pentapeptide-transferase [Acutalibacteraceae bacterium]
MATGIGSLCSALIAFVLTALLGKVFVPFLHRLKYGQTILDIGPSWHKKKEGTPTMGGIIFIIGIVVTSIIGTVIFIVLGDKFTAYYGTQTKKEVSYIVFGLLMAMLYGAIGFIDDYIKVVKKRNLGLTAKQKLLLQFLVAISYVSILALFDFGGVTKIPFVGEVDLGWVYYPLAVILIVGIVNAVNLADGIDGLVGSETFFVSLFFMLISSALGYFGYTVTAAAVAGGCLGFLVWNFHPAKVFMGDTGSLFLGGIICAMGFALEMHIILIILALIYILEMLSVVLQVSYFKLTKGKRLFKMSPIHHHFEMCGWSEVKIVTVFCVFTAIMGVISFLLVVFGF